MVEVIEEKAITLVRGKEVSYLSKIAQCPNCHNELYVGEINDENLDRIDEAYKKQENIITIDEINDILEMYCIGKRPLSKLLGFGEITVTRFLDGKIPSKKSSDVLKEVLSSTEKMREYVNNNKDESLKSACVKVLESIGEIERIKSASKIEQMAQYLLINLEDTTNMAINKLLHFAQVVNYMVYGNPLFRDESQAWIYGPVYVNIYQKYKRYQKDVILPIVKNDNLLDLNQQEREVLDKIILYFGCYSAITLRNMTHVENIWIDARKGLGKKESSEEPIKLKDVEQYAIKLKRILGIESIEDIGTYSEYLRRCERNGNAVLDKVVGA